jgi:predicted RNase H-like HicB family nuclease
VVDSSIDWMLGSQESRELLAYIRAAMRHATYESLPDGEGYYGHIPELPGVWANADTLKETKAELQEVLEEWLTLGIARRDPIPPIDDGIEIAVPHEA